MLLATNQLVEPIYQLLGPFGIVVIWILMVPICFLAIIIVGIFGSIWLEFIGWVEKKAGVNPASRS